MTIVACRVAGARGPGAGRVDTVAVRASSPDELVDHLVATVARLAADPGGRWLGLILGDREEVRYALELGGLEADPVPPWSPPGVRAGALVTTHPGDPPPVRLLESLAGGRHRLRLVLAGEDDDHDALRALLLAGEMDAAAGRARLSIDVRGVLAEAILVTPAGRPLPAGLPPLGPLPVALPGWVTAAFAEHGAQFAVAPRLSGRRRGERRRPARPLAGLPRWVVVALIVWLAASALATAALVVHDAGTAGPTARPRVLEPVIGGIHYPSVDAAALAATGVPAARLGAAAGFDPATDRLVLFGGTGSFGDLGNVQLGDTWSFDGSWHPIRTDWPGLPPPEALAAQQAAMGVDPVTESLIMAGGRDSPAQTWAYVVDGWRHLQPAHQPPACPATSAVDGAARQLVLLSSCAADASDNLQLWTWSGGDWIRVWAMRRPGAAGASMAIASDPSLAGLVAVSLDGSGASVRAVTREGLGPPLGATATPAAVPAPGPLLDTIAPIVLTDAGSHRLLVQTSETWTWSVPTGWQHIDGGPAAPRFFAAAAIDFQGVIAGVGSPLPGTDTDRTWVFSRDGWAPVTTWPPRS